MRVNRSVILAHVALSKLPDVGTDPVTVPCACGWWNTVADETRGGSVECEKCGREVNVPNRK